MSHGSIPLSFLSYTDFDLTLLQPIKAQGPKAGASQRAMQRDIEQIESSGIVLETPTERPNEGLPIGNGRMGTLVWTTPSLFDF